MFKFASEQIRDIIGFAAHAENYGMPWYNSTEKKFPANFSSSRVLKPAGVAQSRTYATVGRNMAKLLNSLYYYGESSVPVMGIANSILYLEMDASSAEPDYPRIFAYDLPTGTVKACAVNANTGDIKPICVFVEGFAGFMLVSMVGMAIRFESYPQSLTSDNGLAATLDHDLRAIYNLMASKGVEYDYVSDIDISPYIVDLCDKMYTGMRDGFLYENQPWKNNLEYEAVPNVDKIRIQILDTVNPGLVPKTAKQPKILHIGQTATAGNGKKTATSSKAKKKVDGRTYMDQLRKELFLPLAKGRVLSAEEEAMVPCLDGNTYVVDNRVCNATRILHDTWYDLTRLGLAANIIFAGDSGSGKTQGAVFCADVLRRPYTKETLGALTEDIIGAFYPFYENIEAWKGVTDKDRAVIETISERIRVSHKDTMALAKAIRTAFADEDVRAEIRTAYGIPTAEEVIYDPQSAWDKMGENSEIPETAEFLAIANEKADNAAYRLLNILLDNSVGDSVSYRFVESEIVKAFRYGWLVEIQEAASVLRPGILTQLNSLLEPNGSIELPNGTRIRRHPDTIVVITTNKEYEGNVQLNESLKDRMILGLTMDNPAPSVMAARLLARVNTGMSKKKKEEPAIERFTPTAEDCKAMELSIRENAAKFEELSEENALTAAEIVSEIAEKAKEMQISGEFGMRSLLYWGLLIRRGLTDIDTFHSAILDKMVLSDDDAQLLEEPYKNSSFCRSITRTI